MSIGEPSRGGQRTPAKRNSASEDVLPSPPTAGTASTSSISPTKPGVRVSPGGRFRVAGSPDFSEGSKSRPGNEEEGTFSADQEEDDQRAIRGEQLFSNARGAWPTATELATDGSRKKKERQQQQQRIAAPPLLKSPAGGTKLRALPIGGAYKDEMRRMRRRMMMHEDLIYGKPASMSNLPRFNNADITRWHASREAEKEEGVFEKRIFELREMFGATTRRGDHHGSAQSLPELSERMRELAKPRQKAIAKMQGIPVTGVELYKDKRKRPGQPRLCPLGDESTSQFFGSREERGCSGAMGWTVGFHRWLKQQEGGTDSADTSTSLPPADCVL